MLRRTGSSCIHFEAREPAVDLCLLSRCKHAILSGGTFSFMIGLLRPREGGLVLFDRTFFPWKLWRCGTPFKNEVERRYPRKICDDGTNTTCGHYDKCCPSQNLCCGATDRCSDELTWCINPARKDKTGRPMSYKARRRKPAPPGVTDGAYRCDECCAAANQALRDMYPPDWVDVVCEASSAGSAIREGAGLGGAAGRAHCGA